jgi:anaerobic selenocysteine-containing dehydrogenase
MASVTYDDYHDARLLILWGANPSASGIHLVPHIREAQRLGAKLIVIDPRATALARQADIHLAVRPGTDLPVALAIHRYLFEEGGLRLHDGRIPVLQLTAPMIERRCPSVRRAQ